METKDNENEALKKIAPHLFTIEKKAIFNAPENYFEKLPLELQDKVNARIKPKSYWVPDFKLVLAAASVSLLIFSGIRFFSDSATKTTEMAASEIAQNFDAVYLASSDEVDLADQLDDESLETTSQQIDASNGVSHKEIEDYLINDNIDITTLTNEF